MEKNDNKTGSSTMEALIIVPIIMVFIMVVVMILLISYEKTAQVMSVHRMAMTNEYSELFISRESEIRADDDNVVAKARYYNKEISYAYDSRSMDVRDVQRLVELILYLTQTYDEELEEILSD